MKNFILYMIFVTLLIFTGLSLYYWDKYISIPDVNRSCSSFENWQMRFIPARCIKNFLLE